MTKLQQVVRTAQQSGDWTEALTMIDQMAAEQPRMLMLKLQLLLVAEKFADAHVLAEELATKSRRRTLETLNQIAWILATRVPARAA